MEENRPIIAVYVSKDTKKLIQDAAKTTGENPSSFLRRLGVTESHRVLSGGAIRQTQHEQ